MSQGLPKQTITIPLGQGLETDVDPKLLPVGKVTQLENMLWTALAGQGTGVKRPGYVAMPSSYVTSGTPGSVPVPWQFALHKGSAVALALAGPRPVSAYSPALAKWLTSPATSADGTAGLSSKLRGQVIASRMTVERSDTTSGFGVASNLGTDVATDGTIALTVWIHSLPSANQLQARFVELSTGKVLFSYVVATATDVAFPRAVYVNGIFTVLWMSGTSIWDAHWSAATVLGGNGAISGFTAVGTAPANPLGFDVITNGSNILPLYTAAAAPSGKTMMSKYSAGSPGSFVAIELLSPSSTRIPPVSMCWVRDLGGAGKVAFVTIGSGGSGIGAYWDVNLTTGVAATFYLLSASFAGAYTMAAHTYSNNATGELTVIWQTAAQPAPIMIGGRTSGGTFTVQTWLNSTSLLSNAFSRNGDFYCLIGYESPTQGTDFIIRIPVQPYDSVDFTQAPSARYCSAKGNGSDRSLVNVTPLSGSRYLASTVVRTRELQTPAGTTVFDLGIDLLNIQFDPATGTAREYADSTYVCGGLLGAFDGQTFAEEGFHVFPETPAVTQTAGGSMTALGSYYYAAVFKYTDANGRVHRSAAPGLAKGGAPPAFVTLTGANRSTSVVVKTLKLTGRPGQNAIELYRTANSGDPPTSLVLLAVVPNNETADTVTIADNNSDASLLGAMPVYTTGNVLPSGPPPTPIALAIRNGQLAAVLADDPTLIQIALPLTDFDGEGWPIFDIEQISSIRIEDAHGDLVALAAMDDKLLAFKSDAVYAMAGNGPDVTGNGTWGAPSIVCVGDGCAQPRSVVETSDGVIFRSTSGRNGYFLINRGLTLQYIGAPVQAYLNDTIVDAVYVASLSRVMFFTVQGRTHVYDQTLKLWTTFTNQAAAAAGLFNGLPIYQQAAQASLSALREDSTGTHWDENGVPNDEYVVTPWLSLAALKTYERFYKLQGIGFTAAGHLLTVTMWTDFNDTTPFSTTTLLIGGNTPDWNKWEFKHSCKATAVRFGIRCSRTPGDILDSAGANITGITIEYGGKAGLRKVPFGNRTR